MESLMVAMLISLVTFSVMLMAFFVYAYVISARLAYYLKRTNYDRWRYLTTVGRFGPGGSNSFRWLPYIFSDLDDEDEQVLRYKDRLRSGFKAMPFIFLAMLVNVSILIFLIANQ